MLLICLHNPRFGTGSAPEAVVKMMDAAEKVRDEIGQPGLDRLLDGPLPPRQPAEGLTASRIWQGLDRLIKEEVSPVIALVGDLDRFGSPYEDPEFRSFLDTAKARSLTVVAATAPTLAMRMKHLREKLEALGLAPGSRVLLEDVQDSSPHHGCAPSVLQGAGEHAHRWHLRVCSGGETSDLLSKPLGIRLDGRDVERRDEALGSAPSGRDVGIVVSPSLPSTTCVRDLQSSYSIDVILHADPSGSFLLDAELKKAGHVYCLGPSDANRLEVTQLRFDSCFFARATTAPLNVDQGRKLPLFFERLRPTDATTSSARFQLRRYANEEKSALWDAVSAPVEGQSCDFLFVGRTLSEVVEQRRLDAVLGDDNRARLVVSNPALLRTYAAYVDDAPASGLGRELRRMLSTPDNLRSEAEAAEESLRKLDRYLQSCSKAQRKRVDVRVADSIIPLGGTVRRARGQGSSYGSEMMCVRLLPPKATPTRSNYPLVLLERRTQRALFQHYLSVLQQVVASAWPVLGEWPDDDVEDLERGLSEVNRGRLTLGQATQRPGPGRPGQAEVYDVAISYASKDEQLAERLRSAFDHEKWRTYFTPRSREETLGEHIHQKLQRIYSGARVVVVVLSEDYVESDWTRYEWQLIQSRQRLEEFLCVVRVDDTPLSGLPGNFGYIEGNRLNDDAIACVRKKLPTAAKR